MARIRDSFLLVLPQLIEVQECCNIKIIQYSYNLLPSVTLPR